MVYLMDEGNLRHSSDVFEASPNFDWNTQTSTVPNGFYQASIPLTNRYAAKAKSLSWTSTAITWMQNPSRDAGVDIVFHAFLANTNSCANNASIAQNSWSNNFSAGIPPHRKEACQLGPANQEIRFRVAAPNLNANSPIYFANVAYDDPVAEKYEIDVSTYYEGFWYTRKDDMRKFCFYANAIGWPNINGVCHQ